MNRIFEDALSMVRGARERLKEVIILGRELKARDEFISECVQVAREADKDIDELLKKKEIY